MSIQPTFEGPSSSLTGQSVLTKSTDILGCQTALYEWAESYDTKDWDRVSKCIAPTLRVGLTQLINLNHSASSQTLTETDRLSRLLEQAMGGDAGRGVPGYGIRPQSAG